MAKMGIKKRLLIQNLSIITLSILLFLGILISGIYHYYYSGTAEILKNHAENSAQFSKRYMELSPYTIRDQVQDIQTNFSLPQAETQVISTDGKMLSSSEGFISHGKLDFPDIQDAFRKGEGTWMGTNPETDEHVLAVSVPLESDGKTVALLRFVSSLEPLDDNFKTILATLIGIGLSILLMVFVISTFFSRMITDPVVELTSASQKLAKGDLEARMTGTYKDEFHTLSQSFNDMGQELLKTEKLKNEFISSVSHELRTPLTSIKGWGETLLTGDMKDEEEMKTGLHIITNETDRLIAMVEELLDFSRYAKGTFEISPHPFPFHRLVQEVVLQLDKKRLAKEMDIVLENGEPIKLEADEHRIRQVILNLLDNAIKYSAPGSTITIRYHRDHGNLVFEVEDEGVGIEKNHLQQVLTLFYKENEKSEGVGLGLAISKQIIELHGGQLYVRSEKNVGTVAGFTLPLNE